MKTIWQKFGVLCFWLSWPFLFVYLRNSIRTRVVIHNKGSVLLVKGWLGAGDWMLPGGGVKRGERVEQGAIREIGEETGIKVTNQQLVAVEQGTITEHGIPVAYVMFEVDVSEQTVLKPHSFEVAEIGWFPIDELDSSPNTSSATLQLVKRWKTQA